MRRKRDGVSISGQPIPDIGMANPVRNTIQNRILAASIRQTLNQQRHHAPKPSPSP
jgi:hypothetical protein